MMATTALVPEGSSRNFRYSCHTIIIIIIIIIIDESS
jgi:hypothetical protein